MRWISLTAVVAGALLIPVSPASAVTLTTENSCKWSDGYWRHLNADLTGTGSPSPVARGSGLNLTAASVHVRLPDYLAQAGHGLGVLKAGDNEIRAKAWIALAAPATPQSVQVFALETVAHTTITEDASGAYQSSTAIDVTVPLPDSAWTAGGAPVAFSQAVMPVAAGAPEAIVDEELVWEVFGLRSRVIPDPVTGTPLCVPIGRTVTRSAAAS